MYITGDIHGEINVKRFNTRNFPQQKNMTKDNYVIIAGDFGLVWNMSKEDLYWLKWLEQKNFTTLFIDGNHENHERLDAYPVELWNGGKIHRITPSIIHLMRGQVFTIEGKKIFTFGGAASHDKSSRKVGVSWWAREMPSTAEYEEGMTNLEAHQWKVDYVITHTCSDRALYQLSSSLAHNFNGDVMNTYFSSIEEKLQYKKWFFGHFHENIELDHAQKLIYTDIDKI